MRGGAVGTGTPEVASDKLEQQRRYQVPLDLQAEIALLALLILLVALLATTVAQR
jgi:hypothetical protein